MTADRANHSDHAQRHRNIVDPTIFSNERGIRAVKWSFVSLVELNPNVAYLRRGKTRKSTPDVIARRLG